MLLTILSMNNVFLTFRAKFEATFLHAQIIKSTLSGLQRDFISTATVISGNDTSGCPSFNTRRRTAHGHNTTLYTRTAGRSCCLQMVDNTHTLPLLYLLSRDSLIPQVKCVLSCNACRGLTWKSEAPRCGPPGWYPSLQGCGCLGSTDPSSSAGT